MLRHINIICFDISAKSCIFVVEKQRDNKEYETVQTMEATG